VAILATLETRARQLKAEVHALYLAARRSDTPWYARLYLVAIVAYVLSPIDLIPDVIPVVGLLDEVILLPFAIALAVRLVPERTMAECRARVAGDRPDDSWLGRWGAAGIILLWLAVAAGTAVWVHNALADDDDRAAAPAAQLVR
jgi:uncharacterized membrane protein YkvA (DUF1232 family)